MAVVAAEAVKNGAIFSQYNEVWGGFPKARGSGCLKV
jgi:hypothetical protein